MIENLENTEKNREDHLVPLRKDTQHFYNILF